MPSHNAFWTELHLRRLRDGIARGENRKVIAAALGCTKNAVIGKSKRLGLCVRYVKDTSDAALRRRLDRRNELAKLRTQRLKEAGMYPVKKPDRPVWQPRPIEAQPVGPPVEGPVTIWQLTETTCRWPLWRDSEPVKYYCGACAAPTQSYCLHHTKVADGRKSA